MITNKWPARIQLRRTKGWRLPKGAVRVARPGKWGNPFSVAEHGRERAIAFFFSVSGSAAGGGCP